MGHITETERSTLASKSKVELGLLIMDRRKEKGKRPIKDVTLTGYANILKTALRPAYFTRLSDTEKEPDQVGGETGLKLYSVLKYLQVLRMADLIERRRKDYTGHEKAEVLRKQRAEETRLKASAEENRIDAIIAFIRENGPSPYPELRDIFHVTDDRIKKLEERRQIETFSINLAKGRGHGHYAYFRSGGIRPLTNYAVSTDGKKPVEQFRDFMVSSMHDSVTHGVSQSFSKRLKGLRLPLAIKEDLRAEMRMRASSQQVSPAS